MCKLNYYMAKNWITQFSKLFQVKKNGKKDIIIGKLGKWEFLKLFQVNFYGIWTIYKAKTGIKEFLKLFLVKKDGN